MEHEYYKRLLMCLLDGELSSEEKGALELHLSKCPECSHELQEFKKMKEVMQTMKYKEPPDEVWERYWTNIYNRLERGLGWILLSIGAIILLFYGGFKLVEDLVKDPTIAIIAKVGILAVLAGVVILLVSVIRERIFTYKTDKYAREVKR
ncbi:MAG TPA: zf-HC2 domain-containing protein [bacterium (Candidatus Stahlbacteria)]|nr:zf-HC2 domain-containing protein [Candidatus Stahlbacteria bacterium]